MTTLDKYILREHLVPFVFGFAVVTFLLSMDFIFDYLDLFVTKGVPGLVVLELYVLGLGWMVAMSVPCAALVAPLMAYGRMAQDNEITALRASGVHLLRLIQPALLASLVLAVLLTLFNNHVLPESNHAFANLMIDIARKKPTLEIEEGVFISDLPGYSLLVEKLDPRTSEMENVTIYQLEDGGKPTTIIAKRGHLSYSRDGNTLTLRLRDGEIHEVPDPRQPQKYRRMQFDRHTIHIKGVGSELTRTKRDTKSDREMSTREMLDRIAEIERERGELVAELDSLATTSGLANYREMLDYLGQGPEVPWWRKLAGLAGGVIRLGPDRQSGLVVAENGAGADGVDRPTISEERAASVRVKQVALAALDRRVNSFRVEVHKKFAIPVACVVFVLIGAPLGIRARRGGVTVGFVSVGFFLFYYICLIGGEQLADRSILPPWLAMWIANIVLGTMGIVFTLRTIEVGRSGVRPAPPLAASPEPA